MTASSVRAISDCIYYYRSDMAGSQSVKPVYGPVSFKAELDNYIALLNKQTEINDELDKVVADERNAQRRTLLGARLSMNRHATGLAKMHVGRALKEYHEKSRKEEGRSWGQLQLAQQEMDKVMNGDETEDEEEEQGDVAVGSST